MRPSLALAAFAFGALLAPLALRAQDTTPPRGVHLGLHYQGDVKPGVVVGVVRGPWGDSVQAIIQRDLDNGDRVAIIGYPGTPAAQAVAQVSTGVNYVIWKSLGAAAALQMSFTAAGLHVAVHDVAAGTVLQARDFALPSTPGSADWRFAVHAASDELERIITGTRGIASTRILFVRGGRIVIIDSDGWGERVLTEPGTALSPAWQPQGKGFAYSTLVAHGWRIMLRDFSGVPGHALGTTPGGLNMSPAFSPDGAWLAYAHGEEDGVDLWEAPMSGLIATGPPRRVTVGRGTDNVSPSWSPDARRLVFTSGRLGHPEIYVADADGSNSEMLTPFSFGEEVYRSNPDWSPDGLQVAYQAQLSGVFQVM
ncbi:MAG TPA: hypothetical protein VMT93_00985, partial [Gemmatimonadaceae bacterium]|nr:hypothetical protein [Gemmatimonadaceae bacterium]